MRYLSMQEVIYIYTEIIKRSGGQPGINDESILNSVLAKPLVTFEGEEIYPDLFTKVAIFLYAFINSRPFVEGNKRAALMCALFLLRANGYHLIVPQEQVIELVHGVESGRYRVDHLVTWFQKNAVPA